MSAVGENGAVVLRPFKADINHSSGDVLSPATVLDMPLNNRLALERAGYIKFLDAGEEEAKATIERLENRIKELEDIISLLSVEDQTEAGEDTNEEPKRGRKKRGS